MPVFASQSREQLRRAYLTAWEKFSKQQPLEPVEAQLAAVISEHPEYIQWLEAGEDALNEEFTPERGQPNPFLHMGLHLAIREQVATNRPEGITAIHQRLSSKLGAHEAEHAMLEKLGETLWEAQRANTMPDERTYMERLRRL